MTEEAIKFYTLFTQMYSFNTDEFADLKQEMLQFEKSLSPDEIYYDGTLYGEPDYEMYDVTNCFNSGYRILWDKLLDTLSKNKEDKIFQPSRLNLLDADLRAFLFFDKHTMSFLEPSVYRGMDSDYVVSPIQSLKRFPRRFFGCYTDSMILGVNQEAGLNIEDCDIYSKCGKGILLNIIDSSKPYFKTLVKALQFKFWHYSNQVYQGQFNNEVVKSTVMQYQSTGNDRCKERRDLEVSMLNYICTKNEINYYLNNNLKHDPNVIQHFLKCLTAYYYMYRAVAEFTNQYGQFLLDSEKQVVKAIIPHLDSDYTEFFNKLNKLV